MPIILFKRFLLCCVVASALLLRAAAVIVEDEYIALVVYQKDADIAALNRIFGALNGFSYLNLIDINSFESSQQIENRLNEISLIKKPAYRIFILDNAANLLRDKNGVQTSFNKMLSAIIRRAPESVIFFLLQKENDATLEKFDHFSERLNWYVFASKNEKGAQIIYDIIGDYKQHANNFDAIANKLSNNYKLPKQLPLWWSDLCFLSKCKFKKSPAVATQCAVPQITHRLDAQKAIVYITANNNCAQRQTIRITSSNLNIEAALPVNQTSIIPVHLLTGEDTIKVYWQNKLLTPIRATIAAADFAKLTRVVLRWQQDVQLDLHVLANEATIGSNYDIWRNGKISCNANRENYPHELACFSDKNGAKFQIYSRYTTSNKYSLVRIKRARDKNSKLKCIQPYHYNISAVTVGGKNYNVDGILNCNDDSYAINNFFEGFN